MWVTVIGSRDLRKGSVGDGHWVAGTSGRAVWVTVIGRRDLRKGSVGDIGQEGQCG